MNISLARTLTAIVAVAVGTAACTRGADEDRLKIDLQQKLDRDVKAGLLEVVAVRREGSAPLPAGDAGTPRVVVYFNATLRLGTDYDFGGWDQLGPSSVAYALGATEKGLFGLEPGSRAGDLVRVYGSAIYERADVGWMPGAAEPARAVAKPNIEGTAPPSRSKQLIDRLAAMVEIPPPGVPPPQDDIIAEELTRASENIERRVKRREHTFTLATGSAEGEYARVGAALITAVNQIAPNVKLRQRYSEGSIENAWLLGRGDADYAVLQGDVAAAAFAGHDLFARGGPLTTLRAIGGLFPEAIHVVVLQDSPILEIRQLRGRRVAIGSPASGTRFNAVSILGAHGLTTEDLGSVSEDSPADVLARLARRQLDAVFLTAAAPARALQELAARPGVRLLNIDDAAIARLTDKHSALARMVLPANTYPRQREPVTTVAATALLVTTSEAPEAEVERVADLVFTRLSQRAARADVARVAAAGDLRGVTIPLHPGAVQHPQ